MKCPFEFYEDFRFEPMRLFDVCDLHQRRFANYVCKSFIYCHFGIPFYILYSILLLYCQKCPLQVLENVINVLDTD